MSVEDADVRVHQRATTSLLWRGVYRCVIALLLPFALLRWWWRGRAEPLYRHAIGERLGFYAGPPMQADVWVHAVSLGETHAAAALIDALRRQCPDLVLLLTHGTATGRAAGAGLTTAGDRQAWLPYDVPGAVRRFLAQHRPRVGVLMETEIWPTLLREAAHAGVPMVSANARLSQRSLQRGRIVTGLLKPALRSFTLMLAQTEGDAQRLRSAGASTVVIAGNLKFDVLPDPVLLAAGRAWRETAGRPIVIAASTREGEESELLDAWQTLAAPRPLLLIVPRHPQRFDEVAGLIAAKGWSSERRSRWGAVPPPAAFVVDAWLGDSVGEMPLYYGCAQVALLGGSFGPFGGQNLIEAAACGCPVVVGPSTYNFALAVELALVAGAAVQVIDLYAAVAQAQRWLLDQETTARSERAEQFSSAHAGAAHRMSKAVAAVLCGKDGSAERVDVAKII